MSLPPIDIPASDKLRVLRRLDQFRKWESLDEKRQCIQCGEVFHGRDLEVVGGTRGLGPLRLQCPTENCPAIPMDWIIPNDAEQSGRASGQKAKAEPTKITAAPARPHLGGWLRLLRSLRLGH